MSKENNANESSKDVKVIASVMKALDVLELIAKYENGLTVTEISNTLGYGTSAAHHLLSTLRLRNYLVQDPVSKRYKLGIQAYLLVPEKPLQRVVTDIAYEYMLMLTDAYDENCNLLYPIGNDVEYIAQTESKQLLRMFTRIGATIPFYCTGGGKVIFAFLPDNEKQKMLNGVHFKKFTQNTISSMEKLLEEACSIRKDGVAYDREEYEPGVFCIAAPIMNGKGLPLAAISMSCPVFRLDDRKKEKMAASIIDAAAKISEKIISIS